jgi:hypothetical protein
MVEDVALGHTFSEYFVLCCHLSFHQCSIVIRMSSWGWKMEPLEAAVTCYLFCPNAQKWKLYSGESIVHYSLEIWLFFVFILHITHIQRGELSLKEVSYILYNYKLFYVCSNDFLTHYTYTSTSFSWLWLFYIPERENSIKFPFKSFEITKKVVVTCFEVFSSGADKYQQKTQNSRSLAKIRESLAMVFS